MKRVAVVPDVPAIAETVPKFEVGTWQGLLAPAGTPQAIIVKLRDYSVKALRTAEVTDRLTAQGYQTVGNTPQEFAEIIRTETARWKSVVKTAGIKPIESAR